MVIDLSQGLSLRDVLNRRCRCRGRLIEGGAEMQKIISRLLLTRVRTAKTRARQLWPSHSNCT